MTTHVRSSVIFHLFELYMFVLLLQFEEKNPHSRLPDLFSFFSFYTELDKKKVERKIVNIFLPISLNMCFGCLK